MLSGAAVALRPLAEPPPTPSRNPWPGLAAYNEAAQHSFNGRDDESEELLRRVSNARLTVLFGKSGLGKSSLLQAGLFPRLRRQNIFPVYVRLKFQDDLLPLIEQVRTALLDQIREWAVDAPEIGDDEGLWEYLHRRDFELWSRSNHLLTPLFVLDQFEEVFTLGEPFQGAIADFRGDIGNLAENGIPRAIAARLETEPSLAERLDVRGWNHGVLICLREDYLPHLEGWRRSIASLGGNRMRLLPMRRRQAFAAVHDAAPELVGEKLAWRIVNHVSAASLSRTLDHGHESQSDSTNLTRTGSNSLFDSGPSIEPALLSLFCAGLYERRRGESAGAAAVRPFDDDLLEDAKEAIIGDFYRDCLKGMPDSVPAFIEQQLISDRGFRNSYPIEDALKRGVIDQDQLKYLVDRRLLRLEQLYGTARVELTHDILTQAVRDERDRRQAEAERAAYQRQAEQAQEALRQHQLAAEERHRAELAHSRQQRRIISGMSLAALLFLMLGAGFVVQWLSAREAFRQALSYKLAHQAGSILEGREPGNLATALLLGVASYRASPDEAAGQTLQRQLEASRGVLAILQAPSPLRAVAFSPDGRIIAAGSQERPGRVLLWDSRTRRPLGKPLAGHPDFVTNLAFSPDGRVLASAGFDGRVILWDVARATALATLQGHTDWVSAIAFSPDGSVLASAGRDQKIVLWDMGSLRPTATLGAAEMGWISALAFNPDGRSLASAGRDGTITLWDWRRRQVDGPPLGSSGSVIFTLAYGPDGRTLAAAGRDKQITLWDTAARTPRWASEGHEDIVRRIAISRDGRLLASASDDHSVRLWDMTTGATVGQPLDGHRGAATGVTFSPDGRTLASVGRDRALILWDVSDRSTLGQAIGIESGSASAAAVAPDGGTVAVAGKGGRVLLCDTARDRCDAELSGQHTASVRAIAFSPDGRTLATGGFDNRLILWDTAGHPPPGRPLVGHGDGVLDIAYSADGRLLASAGRDGRVMLWDPVSQTRLATLPGHREAVHAVAFSPDARTLASASRDNTVILWDIATRRALRTLSGHRDAVLGIAFAPDGRMLASGSRDNSIILWDTASGTASGAPLKGHLDAVRSVAFSIDGGLLVSASDDRTVRLWHTATRRHVALPPQGRAQKVASVAFSRDGRRLLTGGEGPAMLWDMEALRRAGILADLSSEEKLDRLCAKITRNLSADEWQQYISGAEYIEQCHGLAAAPKEQG